MKPEVIAALVAAAVLAVAAAVLLLVRRRSSEKGQRAHVAAILRRFSALRGFKVLSDVHLKTNKGEELVVDQILAGYFGLLLLNVQTQNLDYYGDDKEPTWSLVKEDKGMKVRIPNPLLQNEKAMDALRTVFSKNDVYNVPMEQVVVFTSRFKKNSLNIKDSLPIVNVRRLGAMLDKVRFEKDCGLDLQKVVGLIESAGALK